MITLRQVLVATDFDEASEAALTYGRELASRFDATLHVLHVVQRIYLTALGTEDFTAAAPDLQQRAEDYARRRLHQLVVDSDRGGPPTITAIVTADATALTIVAYAKRHDVDLIVIGTHGRGALGHMLLGNVAERVVRRAPCPVLTVRHPEHEFVRPDTLATIAHA